MAIQLDDVEFLGGPFDGLVRDVMVAPENLPPFAALPLAGAAPGAWGVAYYELQERGGVRRYRFLAVVRNAPRGPSGWFRKTLLRMRRWTLAWRD